MQIESFARSIVDTSVGPLSLETDGLRVIVRSLPEQPLHIEPRVGEHTQILYEYLIVASRLYTVSSVSVIGNEGPGYDPIVALTVGSLVNCNIATINSLAVIARRNREQASGSVIASHGPMLRSALRGGCEPAAVPGP
jgi:hypothetical protein